MIKINWNFNKKIKNKTIFNLINKYLMKIIMKR